jgi:hypothetical protein
MLGFEVFVLQKKFVFMYITIILFTCVIDHKYHVYNISCSLFVRLDSIFIENHISYKRQYNSFFYNL